SCDIDAVVEELQVNAVIDLGGFAPGQGAVGDLVEIRHQGALPAVRGDIQLVLENVVDARPDIGRRNKGVILQQGVAVDAARAAVGHPQLGKGKHLFHG